MYSHSERFSAGSWTQQLYNILCPTPHARATLFKNSPDASKRPPRALWRSILLNSIKDDLADPMNRPGTRRRFVQIESMGLSGLLFYEIPEGRKEGRKDSNCLTFESVMGDLQDTNDLWMDMDSDRLLDTVHGKAFYFPACACTSFLAGQAMHASLINRPDLRPRPSSDGFSVLLSTDARSSTTPISHERKMDNVQQSFLQLEDFVDEDEERYVAELLKSFSSGNLCPVLSPDGADDPHFSLFVRRATLPSSEKSPNRRSSSDLNDLYDTKQEGDSSLDTVESLGIFTPLGLSADVTLGTNDINRHRKPTVDADPPSFLDLSYEDVAARGTDDWISSVRSGLESY